MLIKNVEEGSPAYRAGVRPGESLEAVNGRAVRDVLDYRFYTYDRSVVLTVSDKDGLSREAALRHPEGSDIGLEFETYLMDKERTCNNRCVFCFIDQMPGGCRESLYVKDDDARLSFLLGNYITLTNLDEREVERICAMKISPLGVSVHTTDPEIRVKMLRNRRAGECLDILRRFADTGITVNGQIVLCPGYNDGENLRRTLDELEPLALNSLSVVPVGLTAHREGLVRLEPVTKDIAARTIDLCSGYKRAFCSDELYILAERDLPPVEHYEEFPQLENGVGMLAMFLDEFKSCGPLPPIKNQTVATGEAAAPFLRKLLAGTAARVVAIPNRFFGGGVTVSGLLSGNDYLEALRGTDLSGRVLIPKNSLRSGEDVFLDDMTISGLSELLGVPVVAVDTDGGALWDALQD